MTPATVDRVAELLSDLEGALAAAAALPAVTPDPAVVSFAASLDPPALTPEEVAAVLAFGGLEADTGLPGRMAPVLALLDALPGPLQERLLTEFVGRVFSI